MGKSKPSPPKEIRHLGVDFISLTEQIDTSSPLGKAMTTGPQGDPMKITDI